MTRKSGVEQRLADLVAADTRNPGGDEGILAERLAHHLADLGAVSVEVFKADGHASTFARFGGDTPRLLLNAHIDTVPANEGYTTHPLELVRRENRLHGLGSADTKGAIAAILEAVAMRRASGGAGRSFAVLFSGDEEVGGGCIREFLASSRCAGLEQAIVCEPTGCRLGVRHRGVYAARVHATSPGGHSSLADTVPSPLAALARAAVALEDLGRTNRNLGPAGLQGLCMNIAALDGGLAFNIIPAQATLTFSLRPAPGVDLDAILAKARTAIANASAPLVTELAPFVFNPAFQTQKLAGFAAILGERIGSAVDLPFGTEAGQLVAQGIDAVVFGPGHIEQAHKADEYVDLDELYEAVRVFYQVIS